MVTDAFVSALRGSLPGNFTSIRLAEEDDRWELTAAYLGASSFFLKLKLSKLLKSR